MKRPRVVDNMNKVRFAEQEYQHREHIVNNLKFAGLCILFIPIVAMAVSIVSALSVMAYGIVMVGFGIVTAAMLGAAIVNECLRANNNSTITSQQQINHAEYKRVNTLNLDKINTSQHQMPGFDNFKNNYTAAVKEEKPSWSEKILNAFIPGPRSC